MTINFLLFTFTRFSFQFNFILTLGFKFQHQVSYFKETLVRLQLHLFIKFSSFDLLSISTQNLDFFLVMQHKILLNSDHEVKFS
jgi:hypothetical protein